MKIMPMGTAIEGTAAVESLAEANANDEQQNQEVVQGANTEQVPPEGATSSEKKDVPPVYVAPGSVEELSGEKEEREEKPSKKIKLAHSWLRL